MKRVPVTSDQIEQIAKDTGAQIEMTSECAFLRVANVEYHAPLQAIVNATLDGVA